jgi:hypothetical protein
MKHAFVILILLVLGPALCIAGPGGDVEVTILSGWSFLDVEKENPADWLCDWPVQVPEGLPFYCGGSSTTTVGDSFLIGFKGGYYLNDHVEIEGGFQISPNHKMETSSTWRWYCPPDLVCPMPGDVWFPYYYDRQNLVGYQYDANFVYNLLKDNVRPFVTVGIGGLSTDMENEVRNNFTLNFGAGAKFYFKRAGIRFEVNDHLIPNYFLTGDAKHNLQILYGFLFRVN